jgi:arylsulfatase A-like enzyme
MTATGVRDNAGLGASIGKGVLLLFLVQLALQLAALSSNTVFKGGLIKIQTLVWEGLSTQAVASALLYHFLVYLVILTVISAIAVLAAEFLQRRLKSGESAVKLRILFLLLLYAALMVINVWHYPNSLARLALVNDWQAGGNDAAYWVAVITSLLFLVAAAAELALKVGSWWLDNRAGNRWAAAIGIAILAFSFTYAQSGSNYPPEAGAGSNFAGERPNIILIGLDSVRVDIIEDEALRRRFLPRLDQFLQRDNTTWYPNAYTPIARTFAAWYALLSGTEPRHSGVRYNLQQIPDSKKRDTIVSGLGEKGYRTIYGSDEKRFSAIDESYGFHETFGPPAGAAEWILSILEDTPAHNVLRETPLAPLLFPHSFANRASFTTFKPEHFVRVVQRRIDSWSRQQPLFLSVHLCLSHWPYTWSTANSQGRQNYVEDYFDTLQPLDRQFGEIMDLLRTSGVLDHSVVIVFTDHGEGLVPDTVEDEGPHWKYFRARRPEASDAMPGHGSDLLTATQNQIMISLQDNTGQNVSGPGMNRRFTSLLDITPTIARIAGLAGSEFDGIDLGKSDEGRVIFMETGIDLAALKQANINLEDLVSEGVSAYEIDAAGLLQVKKARHEPILSRKQLGVTDGRFILANMPGSANVRNGQAELKALDIGNPERAISGEEIERNPILNDLKKQLFRHYGEELTAR